MGIEIDDSKLSAALEAEVASRRRVASALSKYLLNPGVPIPVKVLVLGILSCTTLFSVLISLVLVNVIYALFSSTDVNFSQYMYSFLGVAGMLFVILILFGRQAVEYEHYHRTAQGFKQAKLARNLAG